VGIFQSIGINVPLIILSGRAAAVKRGGGKVCSVILQAGAEGMAGARGGGTLSGRFRSCGSIAAVGAAVFMAVLVTFIDYAAAQPADWTLTKTPNPATYSAAGQTINYTYVLTNNTSSNFGQLYSLTDDKATVTCSSPFPIAVPANGTITCTGTYVIQASDAVPGGSVTNTATATGDSCGECFLAVQAQATINFVPPPTGSITIIKTATGGNESFNFTSTVSGATTFALLTVGGTASRVFSDLTPGTYTFSEINLPLHWKLSTLTCTGDSGGTPTTVNLANRSVSIGLDGGESITCTFANEFDEQLHQSLTQEVIRRFLSHRLHLLANDEPDRSRFIRRLPGSLWGDDDDDNQGGGANGPFSFTGSSSGLSSQMSFATSLSRIAQAHADAEAKDELARLMAYAGPYYKAPPRRAAPRSGWDLWVEGHFSEFKADAAGVTDRGHFGILYVGADYVVGRSVLIGALVQFDTLGEKSRTANTAADGWGTMVGPYVSVRLTRNLFFDARAAWGASWNTVDPFGLYQDNFSTDRWLGHAKLTGNWRFGNVRVTPSAGVTYISERQRSYTDSLGVLIPSQTVSLGEFAVGPELAYRFLAASGVIYEPLVSVEGVWDFQRPDVGTVAGVPVSTDEWRARVKAGLLARSHQGVSMRAVVSYDGVGSNSFHSIGGQIWLNIPLR
jgi:outer membrane autotransporter protein